MSKQREQRAEVREPKGQEPGAPNEPPKRVHAGECPKHPSHQQTRVYKTHGAVRYCICDDCGTTWKKTGPVAEAA